MLTIRGATLAGMAAAARLARLGHPVTLSTEGAPLGGYAAGYDHGGIRVDDLPVTFTLPALWRDVFTKSGRPLAGALGRFGLELRELPGVTHRFADGSSFTLPTERGQQFHAIAARFGTSAAEAWRDLLDELATLWQALRRYGVEAVATPGRAVRSELWLGLTVQDLASRMPHPALATMLLSSAPLSGTDSTRAPALVAVRWWLERTFGVWHLADAEGHLAPASGLVDALAHRLQERGVVITEHVEHPTLDCLVSLPPKKLWRRPPRPAVTPRVTHEIRPGEQLTGAELDHTASALRVRWQRPIPGGTLVTTHDYTHGTPDLAHGLAPDDAAAWLARPTVSGQPLRASAGSAAGNEPWAELASAALAVYELHERLTGEDSRPTNRSFVPPHKR